MELTCVLLLPTERPFKRFNPLVGDVILEVFKMSVFIWLDSNLLVLN